jgi:hypothetical protein
VSPEPSLDCFLRSNEWEKVQARDVSFGKHCAAVQLGVPEGGGSTNTATRQGVRPDYELTTRILRARFLAHKPGELLFKITPARFREVWDLACRRLAW